MSKRTLKYKTIAKSEEAPVVGSVVEEKDTIFVKQVSATEFEVFVSDETGYVVKLHEYAITNEKFRMLVLEYLKNFSAEIKNALNHSNAIPINLTFKNGLQQVKVKVVKQDGKEMLYTLKEGNGPLFLDEGDVVKTSSSLNTEEYIIVNSDIVGKDLNSEEIVADTSNGLTFIKVDIPQLDSNSGVINVGGDFYSEDINITIESTTGGSHNLTENDNKVVADSDEQITLRFTGVSNALFKLSNLKGENLFDRVETGTDTVEYTISAEQLRGKYLVLDFYAGSL